MPLQPPVPFSGIPIAAKQRSVAASAPIGQSTIQRALANPSGLSPVDAIALQRSVGNRAVAQLLNKPAHTGGVIQPKLQVGPAGDAYEQEAERVAQQVTQGGSLVAGASKTSASRAAGVQRAVPPKVGPEGGPVDGDLERRIQFASGGQPVPTSVSRAFQQATGSDVSGVKVINNDKSHVINRELGAKAATHKDKILLGKGQSPNDLQLMSHELTHTIQQGAVAPGVQRNWIQRLSEDDAKPGASVNWSNTNLNPTQITEGMVGGLWAFKEQGDDYTLFVKAEYVQSGRETSSGQAQTADKLLDMVGIKVPVSRIILPGSPEHAALVNRLNPSGGDVRYFKVMADAGGKSLKSLRDPTKMLTETDGLSYLQLFDKDAKLPKQLGKQFVVDAAMGMDDRAFVSQPSLMGGLDHELVEANMGNFMVAAGELVAIDNDMPVQSKVTGTDKDFRTAKGPQVSANVIDDLFDRRSFLVNGLFDFMVAKPVQHLITSPKIANWVKDNRTEVVAAFDAGFQDGIHEISTLLQDPRSMQELQTTAQQHESDEEQSSQGTTQYKSQENGIIKNFQDRGEYFSRRAGGASKEQAVTAYTAVKIWSQNPPVDLSLHSALQDKKLTFPKKQAISNKGKSKKQRAQSKDLKKKHLNFVQKNLTAKSAEVDTLSTRITNLQADNSDSGAKATFYAKLPIINWDMEQKTALAKSLMAEITPLGVGLNMDSKTATLAQARRQTLLTARTDFEHRRTDYTQMVKDVKQAAARNKKLGKNLDKYIVRLENLLRKFSDMLDEWDQKWSAMALQSSSKSSNSGGTTTPPRKRNAPWKLAKRPSLKLLNPGKLPPLPQLPSHANNNSMSESEDLTLSLGSLQDSLDEEQGFTLL
jgi:hypothetical protein